MKKIITIIVALFICAGIKAQDDSKDVVYVQDFSYTESVGNSYTKAIKDKVIEGLLKTDRLLVKDAESEGALKSAIDKQTEDASKVTEETLSVLRDLHAGFLIKGHVLSITTTKKTLDSGTTYYEASITYSVTIIDVASGTTKATQTFTHVPGLISDFGASDDTPEQAITSLLKKIITDMQKLVEEHFKLEGTILELEMDKKKVKAYIDLGTKDGLQKGQRFDVFVERQVAGRTSQKLIGELNVTAVEGEDISLCDVRKGGDEIKAAVGEGSKIIIRSKEKSGGVLGGVQKGVKGLGL